MLGPIPSYCCRGRDADRLVPLVPATVGELAERLAKQGLKETEASIANKISRGTFPASFMLAVLKAIEADVVRMEAV